MKMRTATRTRSSRMMTLAYKTLALTLAILLSGLLNAATAVLAAEVVAVEVFASTPDRIIEVEQGKSVTFTIQLSATGNLHRDITETNPATARVDTLYTVIGESVSSTSPCDPKPFWSDSSPSGKQKATWYGAPDPYIIEATVVASTNAVPRDYQVTIPISTSNPAVSGQKLENGTPDRLTIRVIARDNTPPSTSISIDGSLGDNGWYVSATTITLSALDTAETTVPSGIAYTEYSLDNGSSWVTYAGPFVYTEEGVRTILYRSVDRNGNVESARSATLKIDLHDPEIAISGVLDSDWLYEAQPAIDVSDPDPGSGVASQTRTLNGYPYFGLPISEEGAYTLEVTARDYAGRTASRTVRFTIDRTSPVVTITSPSDNGMYNEPQTFAFTVSDLDSLLTVVSSFSNGTLLTAEGAYTPLVTATDRAGNSGSASISFLIDYTAPQTSPEASGTLGANGWWVSPVTLYLTADDPESNGVRSGVAATFYSINGGPEHEYNADLPPVIADNGTTRVTYYSCDRAGNSESSKSIEIRIDTTKPTASLRFEGAYNAATGWYRSAVRAIPEGTDGVSGIDHFEWSLDGSDWTTLDPSGGMIGEGRHSVSVRAVDMAGNVGDPVTYSVNVDLTPPVTSCALDGTIGSDDWYVTPVTVTLSAEDNEQGSGVEATYYTLDGGPLTEYADPFVVADEGMHVLRFYSIDRAGNQEEERSVTFKIDLSPPDITVSGIGNGDWVREATITFDAQDAVSGVAAVTATLNGEEFLSGQTVDTEGDYELVVTATNGAGLSTSTVTTFTIDRTAPEITIHNPADGGAYNKPQVLSFSVVDRDPLVSVGASHPNGFVFSDEGAYTVSIEASDRATNYASRSASFIIDLTPPVTNATLDGIAGDNGWWRSAVTCALNAADPVKNGVASGVVETLFDANGAGETAYSAPFVLLREGRNTVRFYSRDRAGNAEAPQDVDVYIDTGLPEASLTFAGTRGNDDWYVSDVYATAEGTDTVSGVSRFEYNLDDSGWSLYTGPVRIGDGIHRIAIRVIDNAGNVGDAVGYDVKVDTRAPETQCSLEGTHGANGWYISHVTMTLSASDGDGSGVARTEYSFDGSNWQDYEAPLSITNEGVTTVFYRSYDEAGNLEETKSCVVRIDTRPPVIEITGVDDGAWVYEASPDFVAYDPDPGSGIDSCEGRLDGQAFTSGSLVDTEGDHALVVTARDTAGNEATVDISFTVDRTRPLITIIEPLDGGMYNRDVTFDYTVDDRDPMVKSSSTPEKGHVFSDEGAYTVSVDAWDRAGNTAHESASFIIDRTPPETTAEEHGTPGNDGWWRSAVTVYLNANDPESGGVSSGVGATYVRVNGGSFELYNGAGVVVSSEGTNTVDFYSVDRAGNVEHTKSLTVKIDFTGPDVVVRAPEDGATYGFGSTISLDIVATDNASGVRCVRAYLNGTEVALDADIQLLQAGANTLEVVGCDIAGNETRVTRHFTVAFTPGRWLPPVSLTPPNTVGEAWNSGRALPIKFTVLDYAGNRTDKAVATVEVVKDGRPVASGQAVVQYDDGLPFYMFNWKTVKGQTGLYTITVRLNDGVTTTSTQVKLR